MEISSKRVPCNECREHKRRCSGEMPCQRCKKFKLECVYNKINSPSDLAYLNEIQVRQDITMLLDQMSSMEKELHELYTNEPDLANFSTMLANHPVSSTTTTTTTTTSSSSNGSISSSSEELKDLERTDNQLTPFAQSGPYVASTNYPKTGNTNKGDWVLSITKDGMLTIKTTIRSHADLLANLADMVTALESDQKIPPLVEQMCAPNVFGQVLRRMVWSRYGKSRYQSMSNNAMIRVPQPTVKPGNVVDGPLVSRQLIHAYFGCQHLIHIALHQPTFLAMFVDDRSIMQSPAAMALCALATTGHCQHVAAIVPASQLRDYGQFFFELAREPLEDLFDDISLETLSCYVLLAFYKARLSDPVGARLYADLAERLCPLLSPSYLPKEENTSYQATCDADPLFSGKVAMFQRMMQALQYIRGMICMLPNEDKSNAKRNKEAYVRTHFMIRTHYNNFMVIAGDSPKEVCYIQTKNYLQMLREEAHLCIQHLYSQDLSGFVGLFAHQLEYVMRNWYHRTLAPKYRLSLPLFDCTIDPDVFIATIANDCSESLAPIVTTLRVYSEYMLLAKSFLAKSPEDLMKRKTYYMNLFSDAEQPPMSDEELSKFQRRIKKMIMIRQDVGFDGTDEEFMQQMKTVMGTISDIQVPLINLSVRAAMLSLRLLQALNHIPGGSEVCLYDIRLVFEAWSILNRSARYIKAHNKDSSPTITVTLDEIYATLHGYIDLAQQLSESFCTSVNPNFDAMEKEFQSILDNGNEDAISEFVYM